MNNPNIQINVGANTQPSYTYKSKILKPTFSFASQVTEPNCIYVIKWDFDLGGESVAIPENCVLKFEGGSLSNGYVVGDNTIITGSNDIFENIVLDGIFKNNEGFLSWWKTSQTIDNEWDSLIHCFENVIIDKNGTLTKSFDIVSGKKNFHLNGCGNVIKIINVNDTIESVLNLYNCKNIEIKDITFDYNNSVVPSGDDYIRTIKVGKGYNFTSLHNITITNFGQKIAGQPLCNFIGIEVVSIKNSILYVDDCVFSNLIVAGEGTTVSGKGGCYGILVSDIIWDAQHGDVHYGTGLGHINSCYFDNIYNIDSNGDRINDDASGIYIKCGFGVDGGTDCDIEIDNCSFNNCEKRGIKVQANHVVIRNIYSSFSFNDFVGDQLIDIQGSNAYINGVFGTYGGPLFKFNHGNFGVVENVRFISTNTTPSFALVTCYYSDLKFTNIRVESGAGFIKLYNETGVDYSNPKIEIHNSEIKAPYLSLFESAPDSVFLKFVNSILHINSLGKRFEISKSIIKPYDNSEFYTFSNISSKVKIEDSDITVPKITSQLTNFGRCFDTASELVLKNCKIKAESATTIYTFPFIRETTTLVELDNVTFTNISFSENVLRYKGAMSVSCNIILRNMSFNYLDIRTSVALLIVDNVSGITHSRVASDSSTVLRTIIKNTYPTVSNISNLLPMLKKGSDVFVVTLRPNKVDEKDAGMEILYNDGEIVKPNYWTGTAWVDATGVTI